MTTDNPSNQHSHENNNNNNNDQQQEQSKKGKGQFNKNKKRRNDNSNNTVGAFTSTRFVGGTSGMNDHVFQLHSEHKTQSQF